MAYTASIISSNKVQGSIKAVVSLTNGTDTIEKEFTVSSLNDLKSAVKTEINKLDSVDSTVVSNGPFDTTIAVAPPTQAEIDKQAWFVLYNRWITVKTKLIDTGILTGNESQVVTLKNNVQTGFKPAYLTDL